jgi:hypothetical protein
MPKQPLSSRVFRACRAEASQRRWMFSGQKITVSPLRTSCPPKLSQRRGMRPVAAKNPLPDLRLLCFFAAICLSPLWPTSAQNAFQNLDFEAANVSQNQTSGLINATDAFPGWAVFYGANQVSQVLYENYDTGSANISLLGKSVIIPGGQTSLDGNFSAYLQGGQTSVPDVSIRQTALVPVFAQSLVFKAEPQPFTPGPLLVSLGGQNLSYSALSVGPNYTLYGVNIAGFAGSTEQLEFSALQGGANPNDWNLDDIQFSPTPVPEPGTWALLVCGAGVLGLSRRVQSPRSKVQS